MVAPVIERFDDPEPLSITERFRRRDREQSQKAAIFVVLLCGLVVGAGAVYALLDSILRRWGN